MLSHIRYKLSCIKVTEKVSHSAERSLHFFCKKALQRISSSFSDKFQARINTIAEKFHAPSNALRLYAE